MPTTPQEQIGLLHDQLQVDPDRTDGIEATFAFDVSGPAGGSWWIDAKNGTGAVHDGVAEQPSVTIHLSDEVFVKLATKELSGGEAFFNGLLTVEGDESKAMLLAQIFGE
jgi:putative sterol carrier protein